MNPHEVLKRPVITEKNTRLLELNQYTFEVDNRATKAMIKDAVQKIFNVEVTRVNVMIVPGKMRRVGRSRGMTSEWKKAIVSVRAGQRIEAFGI
ncbi:MAG: 50S ribosomal protein L23 [Chloroflexi bacterium]|nr:50S ribosomal protein L23 [Chloroflexota bacterium]